MIQAYNITDHTKNIARQLMDAMALIIVFQSANSILTKGVLRGGGDTKFLMVADILFLWIVSIPLGALAGLYWHLSAFWIYLFLKIDQVIKAIWCVFRLKSGNWIKTIKRKQKIEQGSKSRMKNKITIHTKKVKFRTAPEFYGLFFEDINHAADGGLYPEMIRNRAFEDSLVPEGCITDKEQKIFITEHNWPGAFNHGEGMDEWAEAVLPTDIPGGIQKMLKWSC